MAKASSNTTDVASHVTNFDAAFAIIAEHVKTPEKQKLYVDALFSLKMDLHLTCFDPLKALSRNKAARLEFDSAQSSPAIKLNAASLLDLIEQNTVASKPSSPVKQPAASRRDSQHKTSPSKPFAIVVPIHSHAKHASAHAKTSRTSSAKNFAVISPKIAQAEVADAAPAGGSTVVQEIPAKIANNAESVSEVGVVPAPAPLDPTVAEGKIIKEVDVIKETEVLKEAEGMMLMDAEAPQVPAIVPSFAEESNQVVSDAKEDKADEGAAQAAAAQADSTKELQPAMAAASAASEAEEMEVCASAQELVVAKPNCVEAEAERQGQTEVGEQLLQGAPKPGRNVWTESEGELDEDAAPAPMSQQPSDPEMTIETSHDVDGGEANDQTSAVEDVEDASAVTFGAMTDLVKQAMEQNCGKIDNAAEAEEKNPAGSPPGKAATASIAPVEGETSGDKIDARPRAIKQLQFGNGVELLRQTPQSVASGIAKGSESAGDKALTICSDNMEAPYIEVTIVAPHC